MLYYHFGSKEQLYRALLRQVFTRAGNRLHAIAGSSAPPAKKLEQAISGMAAFIEQHAFFPAIMLREIAEGGARLDSGTLASLAGVPAAFAAIVQQGVAAGVFRPVHPLAAYFQIFPPVVVFLAGSPIRKELSHLRLMKGAPLTQDAFVAYMQDAVQRALAVDVQASAGPAQRRAR
jgi:AcrR family transcriptional regulator